MKPPITAASSMPPYHVNRDILLPEQQVDCRAMGIVTPFLDIRGRAQRKSNLPAHMEQYMWNRGDAYKSRFRA